MAGASGGQVSGGEGGIDGSSSAAAETGDTRTGNRAYGGISIGQASSGFSINPQTIMIGVVLLGGYLFAKKKGYL